MIGLMLGMKIPGNPYELKILLLTFFLGFNSFLGVSQNQKSEVALKLDSIKIIGMHPDWDEKKKYEKYDFIITDPTVVDSVLKAFSTYKMPADRKSERDGFNINLTKNDKWFFAWSIYPKYNTMSINGKYYHFNMEYLAELARKYPLRYWSFAKPFDTKKRFTQFSDSIKKESNFLYYSGASFIYQGQFDIKIIRSNKFPNPAVIMDSLKPYLKKLSNGKEHYTSYGALGGTEMDVKNGQPFTITITGTKDLFDKFSYRGTTKCEWIPEKNIATVYIRK